MTLCGGWVGGWVGCYDQLCCPASPKLLLGLDLGLGCDKSWVCLNLSWLFLCVLEFILDTGAIFIITDSLNIKGIHYVWHFNFFHGQTDQKTNLVIETPLPEFKKHKFKAFPHPTEGSKWQRYKKRVHLLDKPTSFWLPWTQNISILIL